MILITSILDNCISIPSKFKDLARSYRASYLNKSKHEQAASKDRETVAERSCWLPRGKLARAAWLPPLHLDPPGRCCPVKDVLRSLLIPSNLYRSTITPVVYTLCDTPLWSRTPRIVRNANDSISTLPRQQVKPRLSRRRLYRMSHHVATRRLSSDTRTPFVRDSFDPRLDEKRGPRKGKKERWR